MARTRIRKGFNNMFDELNLKYFDGELPRHRVLIAINPTSSKAGIYDPYTRTICLRHGLSGDELLKKLLHEMIHVVAGPGHDECFLAELRRIAALGERTAHAELAEYQQRAQIREQVVQLLTEGLNLHEISRRLGIPLALAHTVSQKTF